MINESNGANVPTENNGSADYDTVVRLLLVTREKLSATIIASTELEVLLSIERERAQQLQDELAILKAKDTLSGTK